LSDFELLHVSQGHDHTSQGLKVKVERQNAISVTFSDGNSRYLWETHLMLFKQRMEQLPSIEVRPTALA